MKIFTIHHTSATGGSIISQVIAAATNSILISEINPYHLNKKKNNSIFDPQILLDDLQINSEKLDDIEQLNFFIYQMQIAVRHSIKLSKNLVLRDHSHSTFNFKNKNIKFFDHIWDSKFNYSLDSLYKNIDISNNTSLVNPILSIRHPLDSYISKKQKNWLNPYCNKVPNFNEYCKGIVRFQKYFVEKRNAVIIRYEDICNDIQGSLSHVFQRLNVEYSVPTINQINDVKVSGKSGRQSSLITKRKRKLDQINDELIKSLENSDFYKLYCDLNSYELDPRKSPC